MDMKKVILAILIMGGAACSNFPAATPDNPPSTNTRPLVTTKADDLFGGEAVAKGKGFTIKRSQLDDSLISIKSSAASRGQTIPPDQMTTLESQVLDRLIQIQLLLAKATDEDRTKGKETSAKRFEVMKTRSGSEEAMNRQLKSVGLTPEELKSKMLEEATAEAVLERELKVTISDDEVKKFYDDNPARFEQPEMVRASHILIGTRDSSGADLPADKKAQKRKLAEDLQKRAKAGEDFAKLAKENSEDPGSKDKGGEYTFPRGQMVPEFEATAFSLGTNQISDIVTTQYGYHIIKASEKIPAKKADFAKVSPDIRDYLKQAAVQKQLPDYVAKLKKESSVEILDAKLAAAATNRPPPSASAELPPASAPRSLK
jgi:parvulin-like peptidyl-prolyl isomerase